MPLALSFFLMEYEELKLELENFDIGSGVAEETFLFLQGIWRSVNVKLITTMRGNGLSLLATVSRP